MTGIIEIEENTKNYKGHAYVLESRLKWYKEKRHGKKATY